MIEISEDESNDVFPLKDIDPSDGFFVDSSGNLFLKTNKPVLDGNEPTKRCCVVTIKEGHEVEYDDDFMVTPVDVKITWRKRVTLKA